MLDNTVTGWASRQKPSKGSTPVHNAEPHRQRCLPAPEPYEKHSSVSAEIDLVAKNATQGIGQPMRTATGVRLGSHE